jgi:hypothetical protein
VWRGQPLQRLAEAQRLFNLGQFAEAAVIFTALAQGAEARSMPRRAAQLHLQLLRCHALSDWPRALAEGQTALALLTSAGLQAPAGMIFAGVAAELRQRGLTAQAGELEAAVKAALGGAAVEAVPAGPPAARNLPDKCPQCGGTVRSDAVEWIDERSAECAYCGSTLPAA